MRSSASVRTTEYNSEEGPTMTTRLIEVDVLKGDGCASVGSSIKEQLGTPYNRFVAGLEIWVEIKCNQDNDTMRQAYDAVVELQREFMQKSHKNIVDVVKHYENKFANDR
jgi:hypothetical protein